MQSSSDKGGNRNSAAAPVRQILAAVIIATGLGLSAPSQAADLKARFDQVSIGITQEAVVSLMGTQPTSTQEVRTLGIPTSRLRWEESMRVYQVSLMFGRVIETRECSNRNEC